MKYLLAKNCRFSRHDAYGFTLVELLVSMLIALFLLGGLLTIVQNTRTTFGNQNQLAQLQDNQRLAMTFIANVVETGGYYPNPMSNDPNAVFPLSGALVAGQTFFGTRNSVAPGDSITVRYAAAQNENVFNCRGTQSAVVPYDTFVNKLWINNNGQLTCTFSGKAAGPVDVALVNNVQNLQIMYGVQRNGAAATGSCTDTYLSADLMSGADWSNVCSVTLTLIFNRPDPNAPVSPSNKTTSITRVVAVMNKAGVNS